VKRIIVSGRTAKPAVEAAWHELVPWLRERAEIAAEDDALSQDLSAVEAELVVVLGGDGAILSVARRLGTNQVPVVGVNLGKLGFLAELSPESLREQFDAILAGQCRLSPRMMLACELRRDGAVLARHLGLNDAVVSRGALSRLVTIGLFVDGKRTTTYNGDGVIISTPTGSTAHSLSAGGPVLDPQLQAMVVTPICPHTLTNRPVVLPADGAIELRAEATPVDVGLTIDGQVYEELCEGDAVRLRRADQTFQLVDPQLRTFYDTLREKLYWGSSAREGHRRD
jgi:NAD+ kinase